MRKTLEYYSFIEKLAIVAAIMVFAIMVIFVFIPLTQVPKVAKEDQYPLFSSLGETNENEMAQMEGYIPMQISGMEIYQIEVDTMEELKALSIENPTNYYEFTRLDSGTYLVDVYVTKYATE